jgi:uncharacterized membrane protein YsdA (DUF1294 family)
MNKFWAGMCLSALLVVGIALAYLTSQVPDRARGPVTILLVLGLVFGPLAAHIAHEVVSYKTAKLAQPKTTYKHEQARWAQSTMPKRSGLQVVKGEGGGQRAL